MWRRFGDVTFGVLVAVAVTLEAVPVALLTWSFVRRAVGELPAAAALATLVGAVGTASMALVLLTGYVLGYQLLSEGRERRAREQREDWVGRWLRVLFAGEPPPHRPLPRAAVEAILDIRETLRGSAGERVSDLVRRFGVAADLRRRIGGAALSGRLEGLEALAKARLPEFLPDVLHLVGHSEPALRVAAARTAARILAATPPGSAREDGAAAFAQTLRRHRLPAGVVEEALLLVEDAAAAVGPHLLHGPEATEASIRAGLEMVGRRKLIGFAEEASGFVGHHDPEVRAAALRTLFRVGFVPPRAEGAVLDATADAVAFVRVNACRAARLVRGDAAPGVLWDRLADPSWWVRRAAAESLAAMGHRGAEVLARAAREHPDRYGRDMAAQVLRDAGLEAGP